MKYLFLGLFCGFTISLFSQISFRERANNNQVIHKMETWTIGGGTSFYDFTGDGLDDLTLGTEAGRPIGFFVNTGTGFEKIAPLVNNVDNIKQILWADYDNDGDPDLYLSAFDGINRFYENAGNLALKDRTAAAGFPLEVHRGYGACWGDYNRDGWLDLYYTDRDIPGSPNFLNKNRLFKNNADGTFTEVTQVANASDAGRLPFCAAFLDYNNDKWPDIYIANDRLRGNSLLQNEGNGVFRDVSVSTRSDLRMDGMCVNAADLNRDGWIDIYVTNTSIGNKMLLNNYAPATQKNTFSEVAEALGIGFFKTGWGSNFFDADNDGDLDLYVSGSEKEVGGATTISSLFYENMGDEQFEIPNINGFSKDTTFSFSNAIGDFNQDGFLDIIVQNNPPFAFHLWENRTNSSNRWVKFRLQGVKSNKDGIGVRYECYAGSSYQSGYTFSGFSFLGQNSYWQHLGIGSHDQIDSLIVTWPTGHIDKFFQIAPRQSLTFREGESTDGTIEIDEDISILEGNFPTSVINIQNDFEVKAFPNPATAYLNIQAAKAISTLIIYNTKGQTVKVQQTTADKNQFIEVNDLKNGVYWLKVIGQEQTAVLKWIKCK